MRSTLFTITIASWSVAIRAAVIPSNNFLLSGDEKIPSKYKSQESVVEYQLPESVSTYASNWGDNYQTYRYHSLMHQPEPFAFGETNEVGDEDESSDRVKKESRFPWFGEDDDDEDAFEEEDEAEEAADNLLEVEIGDGLEDEDDALAEEEARTEDKAKPEDEAEPKEKVTEDKVAAEEIEDADEVDAEEFDDDDDDEVAAEELDEDEEGTAIEEEEVLGDSETIEKRSDEFSDIEPAVLVIDSIERDQAQGVHSGPARRKDRVSSNSIESTNSTVGRSPCIVPLYDRINELGSDTQPSSSVSNRENASLAHQKMYSNEGVHPISCAMFGITIALAFCTTML